MIQDAILVFGWTCGIAADLILMRFAWRYLIRPHLIRLIDQRVALMQGKSGLTA